MGGHPPGQLCTSANQAPDLATHAPCVCNPAPAVCGVVCDADARNHVRTLSHVHAVCVLPVDLAGAAAGAGLLRAEGFVLAQHLPERLAMPLRGIRCQDTLRQCTFASCREAKRGA